MSKIFYKGISFTPYEKNKSLVLTNLDLVKQDLLNHIFTRRGERIMMPRFGTRIPDLLMEPLDEITISTIELDLIDVFDYDPRVQLLDLRVLPLFEEKAIIAEADLRYIEMRFEDTFEIRLEFET